MRDGRRHFSQTKNTPRVFFTHRASERAKTASVHALAFHFKIRLNATAAVIALRAVNHIRHSALPLSNTFKRTVRNQASCMEAGASACSTGPEALRSRPPCNTAHQWMGHFCTGTRPCLLLPSGLPGKLDWPRGCRISQRTRRSFDHRKGNRHQGNIGLGCNKSTRLGQQRASRRRTFDYLSGCS